MINVKSATEKVIKAQKMMSTSSRKNEKCNSNADMKPVTAMVERFVQSLSNANDSGSFDASFEVKTINHPQRNRSKCVTELDRENLMKFVKEFEERSRQNENQNQCNLNSPRMGIGENILQKHKIYENSVIMSAPHPIRSKSTVTPLPIRKISNDSDVLPLESISTDSDFESTDQDFCEDGDDTENDDYDDTNMKTPQPEENSFKKPNVDERSSKSCRVLQFFSSARKKVKNFKSSSSSSCNSSRNGSPVAMRHHLGVKPLAEVSDTETEYDDGISTGSRMDSRNISPDSSFEFHPPIVPTFKLTPQSSGFSNPAYELAKILRGSFHAKRASVTTLRRSISDPDKYDLQNPDSYLIVKNSDFMEPRSSVRSGIGAAMIRNLDILCSRALPSSTSPFRRWGQSSFRASKTSDSHTPLARRPSSLAASETDVYSKSMDDFIDDINSHHSCSDDLSGNHSRNHHHHHHQHHSHHHHHSNSSEPVGVASWGNSFEKLLEDPAGLHTFAEFLKKEFSAENIYFWTACERYRQIDSETERAAEALQIFSKHLATRAPEPVNVDSQARNIAEESLKAAERNLFNQAQKQIFNLMKFDSYQRFIRSDLYKKCLEAESKNQPLPYPGDKLDELLRTTLNSPGPSKLKKSASNAEDRRRKSLLPWHRKTRSKSRDRGECDHQSNKSSAKSQSSGHFLKLPNSNSASDIHSSRSSLSSFDATAAASIGSGSDDPKTCSLCRVILCDGATTIVQTRPNETIKQLVDRLLDKRGIHYQFYDVILNGQVKSIDLENPSTMLAGKEVQIEHRVAFKLDLPDPKVISVKSKPKKALCEVLKPILHKYNYRLEDVQVLIKETHEELDMSLPVTEIDSQRLQVVLIKSEDWKQDSSLQQKQTRPSYPVGQVYKNQAQVVPKNAISFSTKPVKSATQQTTLDEITNKVFNELLQGKVDSHGNQGSAPKASDRSSLKSDDCASESSSIFERLRNRDSGIPSLLKISKPKKVMVMPSKSSAGSEDGLSTSTQVTGGSDPTNGGIKKPLIAKWKAGVKLQVPGRTENHHEEFLEGLKRAQRARLEDQRGTEINSELPDFLKDKENFNAANKLRKTRASLSPVGGPNTPRMSLIASDSTTAVTFRNGFEMNSNSAVERPQPAPRLSISKTNQNNNVSPIKMEPDPQEACEGNNSGGSNTVFNCPSGSNNNNDFDIDLSSKGPPPLPPKPKVLPMKPSNWGQGPSPSNGNNSVIVAPSKIPVVDVARRHLSLEQSGRNVYLDQPSSSFV